ncbi:ribosomal protein S18 acetylase RimI-like enzyme [Pseudonocardia hierapolitana]|uniref:Ribosomal protein S18 acetylase RimI-like enzyme n=1 Tax=Pseudonocardia hierapolitana TaxID=1128676 RepID=A0A561SN40_9PSEU|nr:GNAT family N-acetyltransferase [Pseudonocardia hierapolitana]TWF76279.1 ribosomal protein S18 acetylase RimI-like enzyme [Pseudonocardia hierapolitana]
MPPIEIRPFRRSDRDQLTELVNAHVEAVLPGVSVSPNAVLSQLEREPDEIVVDPWVTTRHTLVAIQRDRLVAAAHLRTFADEERVAPDYRGAGEFLWLLCWPSSTYEEAADALAASAIAALERAGVRRIHGDGSLPAPATYGIPDVWPHVAAALERAGFSPGARIEVILVADVADLPRPGDPPVPGLGLRTALGGRGTRLTAVLDGQVVGIHEVQTDLTAGGTRSRLAGWAEVWELDVDAAHRRRGIGTWLVGHAADRLRLARADRLLTYAVPDEDDGELPFLQAVGFRELTRTRRGWLREP